MERLAGELITVHDDDDIIFDNFEEYEEEDYNENMCFVCCPFLYYIFY